MENKKKYYRCEKCNYETSQWLGRCPNCGSWNTLLPQDFLENNISYIKILKKDLAKPINKIKFNSEEYRYQTGIMEFDRVLGGGIVPGSLTLIGGEPGIGKSTLALQITTRLAEKIGKILYITAEESLRQISLRASRLSVNSNQIYLISENELEQIIAQIKYIKPKIAIIDSIQIINDKNIPSAPGSVSQVKSCTSRLMEIAKRDNIALIIIGHVTKDGEIAGPKILEHIVDTVLYLEGERFQTYRLLRSIKNRFGTTNELGIFQMENNGLKEVVNPSKILLSSRSQSIPGTVTTITFEGSRPLAVEIEALTSPSYLNYPRRVTTGVDYNRVSLIIAILENKLKIQLQNKDIYINTAGGIKISEPAIDLGIAVAILSSLKGLALPLDTIVFGELGLTGEVRTVGLCERRLSEAQKIGYKKSIIPFENAKQISNNFNNLEIKALQNIEEIISFLKK
jgi:DNA repair protein RadA/Sms